MATVTVEGFDELSRMFDEIGDIPFEVLSEALEAMGTEAQNAVFQTGTAMGVRDPESNVHILDKLRHSKPKKTEDGGSTYVTFSGSRTRGKTRTRNAEIAFVNEYGKQNQQARPFIRQAAEQYADQIAAPGERILGDWQEKTFADGGRS